MTGKPLNIAEKRRAEIKKQAAACRKAFKGIKAGSVVQHCHHNRWLELLYAEPEERIEFILREKPLLERAERLRLFRPFSIEGKKFRHIKALLARRDKIASNVNINKGVHAWDEVDTIEERIERELTRSHIACLHDDLCSCPYESFYRDIFGRVEW